MDFRNNKEIEQYNKECFAKFREENKDCIEEVKLKSIVLKEKIHKKRIPKFKKEVELYLNSETKPNVPLIVSKKEDEYVLFVGWKYYYLALALGENTVKCIVVDSANRASFMDEIGCIKPYKTIKIEKLLIPASFDCTIVNPKKLEEIKEYDYKNHAPAKPIVINKRRVIKDGYSQYIYNRNMGYDFCEVLVQ